MSSLGVEALLPSLLRRKGGGVGRQAPLGVLAHESLHLVAATEEGARGAIVGGVQGRTTTLTAAPPRIPSGSVLSLPKELA